MKARKSSRQVQLVRQAAIETLESRQLMSASMADASTLLVNCGNGNDVVSVTLARGTLYVSENGVLSRFSSTPVKTIHVVGNGGSDYLKVSSGITIPAVLEGVTGNDTLIGGAGNDELHGGDGDDLLDGGAGADVFDGGNGSKDVADYSSRVTPITIDNSKLTSFDSDDGAAGEGDRIYFTVEEFRGGSGNDTFKGGKYNERFIGNGGNDMFSAGGGNDYLNGGPGNDSLDAGEGNDTVFAGAGDDMLFGKAGNDFLMGEAGNDYFDGDYGSDYMSGGDGVDSVGYFLRTKSLFISTDNNSDDGETGEDDNVRADIEIISGGSASDRIIGGDANNRIFGNGGNDSILGGGGNDYLDGGEGNDSLAAGGGAGIDTLLGGNGDDTLSSIGGGADVATGGAGNDLFWVDALDTTDATAGEKSAGHLISVSSYSNGAAFEPNGQDIADPSLSGLADRKVMYGPDFSNFRLFASSGPFINEVDQNNLGTCWFMSVVAGIARAKPDVIRTSVAELGDGTYVVRLFSGGTAKFYRVDGQLPVDIATGTTPQFAMPQNGSIWAPILEKAMALHRTVGGTYKGAESGFSTEAFAMFNKGSNDWDTIWHSENSMAQKMKDVLAAGGACTVGSDSDFWEATVEPNHAYTVIAISADNKSITLRNPWGTDGPGTHDIVDDGYITISMTQFDDDFAAIYYSYLT
jgi:Ca2+-binding RTX toxin-like protein